MRRSEELEAILRSTPWMMEALMAAREVDAPDWLIGAGAMRTAVWDSLHGFDEPTALADLDLVFFDPADLSEPRERALEDALRAELPSAPWDATNQRLCTSGSRRGSATPWSLPPASAPARARRPPGGRGPSRPR